MRTKFEFIVLMNIFNRPPSNLQFSIIMSCEFISFYYFYGILIFFNGESKTTFSSLIFFIILNCSLTLTQLFTKTD